MIYSVFEKTLRRAAASCLFPVWAFFPATPPCCICWPGDGYFLLFICSTTTWPFLWWWKVLCLKHKLERLNFKCRLCQMRMTGKTNKPLMWLSVHKLFFIYKGAFMLVHTVFEEFQYPTKEGDTQTLSKWLTVTLKQHGSFLDLQRKPLTDRNDGTHPILSFS